MIWRLGIGLIMLMGKKVDEQTFELLLFSNLSSLTKSLSIHAWLGANNTLRSFLFSSRTLLCGRTKQEVQKYERNQKMG